MLNYFSKTEQFDRPIFLIGSGKSGTTLFGLLFQLHPDVGPKNKYFRTFDNPQQFISAILDDNIFNDVANSMEEKAVWDKYFPMPNGVELRQGKELIIEENPLSRSETKKLKNDLSKNFRESRFFSKQPFNTFRIRVLADIFPDAKFIALHRDGRDVISSWGRKGDRYNRYGGYKKAIKIMGSKWNEAIDYIELNKSNLRIHIVRYEDLIANPSEILESTFQFCELSYPAGLYNNLNLRSETGFWKSRIPSEFHGHLLNQIRDNLHKLGYI